MSRDHAHAALAELFEDLEVRELGARKALFLALKIQL